MHATGFELVDMLLCCKFAEGDSRILQQKLTRDRLKALQKGGAAAALSGLLGEHRAEVFAAANLARKLQPARLTGVAPPDYPRLPEIAELACGLCLGGEGRRQARRRHGRALARDLRPRRDDCRAAHPHRTARRVCRGPFCGAADTGGDRLRRGLEGQARRARGVRRGRQLMITGEIYVLRYIRLCARRRRTSESFSFRAASCVRAVLIGHLESGHF